MMASGTTAMVGPYSKRFVGKIFHDSDRGEIRIVNIEFDSMGKNLPMEVTIATTEQGVRNRYLTFDIPSLRYYDHLDRREMTRIFEQHCRAAIATLQPPQRNDPIWG